MARFLNEAVDTRGWAMVPVPHLGWAEPQNVEESWTEIGRWLNDPGRPGDWLVASGAKAFYYFISDPNVAFEFKIRFG